ncbi:MAG TPA: sulfatase [Lachnospiraceae bacterium]|nr:sulfatase [Lachnospiraceae bacterium]
MTEKRMMKKLKNILMYILLPAVMMYLFEAYTHDPFKRMYPGIQLLNILLFILINTLFFFLTGRLKASLRIMSVVFMALGLAEYYLVEFRGVTLLPWDIGSLGTAAEVAGGYDYMPGKRAILCIIGFVLVFIVSGQADLRIAAKSRWRTAAARCAGVLVSVALIAGYTLFVQTGYAVRTFGFYTKLFTPTAISERDGTLTAFLMELQYMSVERPEGYSEEKAEEILSGYEAVPPEEVKANIIVVMNEAFSDPKVLGEFETDRDYMPYVHELQAESTGQGEGAKRTPGEGTAEDVRTGTLNVSIVGGNTPNTEFEFLTGDTLRFLPEGSIPYQQYVHEGIYAMPSYLSDKGYTTIGMHPYYSKGWERERVYPELGFEKSLFIEDFTSTEPKLRGYISDIACFGQIIKEYEENRRTGRPLFVFCVTMQNHSPYDKASPGLEDGISIQDEGHGAVSDTDALERYLTLVERSDEAFRYLTGYFADVDEPTVIVMFGDHQPSDSVVRPVWEMQGKNSRALSEEDVEKRYEVPYVIWANYELPHMDEKADTSANFLGNRVLLYAGAGLYPYRGFLRAVEDRYPVLSAVRTTDESGSSVDEDRMRSDGLISDYRILQYHDLDTR